MTKLQEVIDTYQELQRMHQLNIELLEQFSITCDFLLKNNVPIPNKSIFTSLLSKAMTLLDELQSDSPKILQYTASRRKVTDYRTDEDVPVPR